MLEEGYFDFINPFALGTAKTLWSFGHSECKRVPDENARLLSCFPVDCFEGTLIEVNCYIKGH